MGKNKNKGGKGVGSNRKKTGLKAGIASGGFFAAVIIAILLSLYTDLDIGMIVLVFVMILSMVIAIPTIIMLREEDSVKKDMVETCVPIMEAYKKSRSTKKLIEDYERWKEGDHWTYNQIHFGADVIDALQEAREFETALAYLYEMANVPMKMRERYDYDNYRALVEPELKEGIEKKNRQAEERARNKNLKKK